jgi:hypothetical protein
MITSKIKVTTIDLTIQEREALETVFNLMCKLNENYGKQIDLISPNTGECISMNELPRVRGILDSLMTNRVWQVE